MRRVRAQFSYDPADDESVPCRQAALAFRRGNVLEIVSQDDVDWWQARPAAVDHHVIRGLVGLIPAARLLPERYNAPVIYTTMT